MKTGLIDPNSIQEVFANKIVGIQIRDGMAHVTFAVERPGHRLQTGGVTQELPRDQEQAVSARLVLTLPALFSTAELILQMRAGMVAAKPTGGQTPPPVLN